MSRNLLVIAQVVDENDDHRGFFIDWLKEFAKRFDHVSVITLGEGSHTLPANVYVYSLGKERGVNKFIQTIRFYKYLIQLVPQSEGVFAQSSPIFVIASWPVTFIFRKKIILWYLHRSVTTKLKLAEKLCYRIVTSTKESLGLKGKKIIETGHGINTDRFDFHREWTANGPLKMLSVGRISTIKNFETVIEAVRILKDQNQEFSLKIIGRPVMKEDQIYHNHLKNLVSKYNLSTEVNFVGAVPYEEIAPYYREADYFIGALPTGGIDKAMLEAMASGEIVLTSNKAFTRYLGGFDVVFEYGNPVDLAHKILDINSAPVSVKEAMSKFFINSVKENHSLQNLIAQISNLI